MKIRISMSIPLLLVCGAAFGQEIVPQGDSLPRQGAKKVVITADDLNGRYVVHGPLGVPLGEVITVVAEAVEHIGKGETEFLKVISVNGKQLKTPIEVPYSIRPWAGFDKFEVKKSYQLRVYQTGGFSGVPEQAMKETVSVQTHGYFFSTNLVVVRSLEPAEKARPKQPR